MKTKIEKAIELIKKEIATNILDELKTKGETYEKNLEAWTAIKLIEETLKIKN